MEKAQHDDAIFFSDSIQNINNYLLGGEYKKAFYLLILILERLDDNQKSDFINYYKTNVALLQPW